MENTSNTNILKLTNEIIDNRISNLTNWLRDEMNENDLEIRYGNVVASLPFQPTKKALQLEAKIKVLKSLKDEINKIFNY